MKDKEKKIYPVKVNKDKFSLVKRLFFNLREKTKLDNGDILIKALQNMSEEKK